MTNFFLKLTSGIWEILDKLKSASAKETLASTLLMASEILALFVLKNKEQQIKLRRAVDSELNDFKTFLP
jgi:hypothetical protein